MERFAQIFGAICERLGGLVCGLVAALVILANTLGLSAEFRFFADLFLR